jgi:hypothetical protein
MCTVHACARMYDMVFYDVTIINGPNTLLAWMGMIRARQMTFTLIFSIERSLCQLLTCGYGPG